MELPEDLKREDSQDVVYKLNKSFYGLKQAPRCWSEKFRELLRQFDFCEGEADKCIFRGRIESTDVYLALFVDDGLIAAELSSQLLNLCVMRSRLQSVTGIFLSVFKSREITKRKHFSFTKKPIRGESLINLK